MTGAVRAERPGSRRWCCRRLGLGLVGSRVRAQAGVGGVGTARQRASRLLRAWGRLPAGPPCRAWGRPPAGPAPHALLFLCERQLSVLPFFHTDDFCLAGRASVFFL